MGAVLAVLPFAELALDLARRSFFAEADKFLPVAVLLAADADLELFFATFFISVVISALPLPSFSVVFVLTSDLLLLADFLTTVDA